MTKREVMTRLRITEEMLVTLVNKGVISVEPYGRGHRYNDLQVAEIEACRGIPGVDRLARYVSKEVPKDVQELTLEEKRELGRYRKILDTLPKQDKLKYLYIERLVCAKHKVDSQYLYTSRNFKIAREVVNEYNVRREILKPTEYLKQYLPNLDKAKEYFGEELVYKVVNQLPIMDKINISYVGTEKTQGYLKKGYYTFREARRDDEDNLAVGFYLPMYMYDTDAIIEACLKVKYPKLCKAKHILVGKIKETNEYVAYIDIEEIKEYPFVTTLYAPIPYILNKDLKGIEKYTNEYFTAWDRKYPTQKNMERLNKMYKGDAYKEFKAMWFKL